ncbi:MAG: transposase [Planctomycetaceae bacterium]|nr:transposase [Planctomycetaceae bacterium]
MAEHAADQARFLDEQLTPVLTAAQAGQSHVFFVDAAHFVYGTFLCCLWSFTRLFVRAASGRQRFNVLGAWNAVTRQLVSVTNTTVTNTATMCELLHKIAALGLTGPITLVLDNARYQRNAVVMAYAEQWGITLMFLPSYSPNLNLIERLLEVHQTPFALRPLSSHLRQLPRCHRRDTHPTRDHLRHRLGLADDSQLPTL